MSARPGEPRPVVVALGAVDPAVVTGGPRRRRRVRHRRRPTTTWPSRSARSSAPTPSSTRRSSTARPGLRVLARTGVGIDLVDLDAATARGIAVVVTPGSGTRAVAEGVIAHALHLVKRLGTADRAGPRGPLGRARPGRPDRRPGRRHHRHRRLRAYRAPGRRTGRRVRDARAGVRPVRPPPPDVDCPDLGELAAASDVLTLHVPLTDRDPPPRRPRRSSPACRHGAILVNCGRGGLVDLDAALAALESGRLGRRRPRRLRPGAAPPPPAVRPPGRRPHPAPDGADPPRHRGHVRRRRPRCRRRARRARRPAAVANPDWVRGRRRSPRSARLAPPVRHTRKAPAMRLGLIGLGRIGAFHADTLVEHPRDRLAGGHRHRAGQDEADRRPLRRQRGRGVDSVAALLASDVDGVVIAAGTDAHPELILACVEAGLPTLLREAGRADRRGGGGAAPPAAGLHGPGPDRVPAPLRRRHRRGPGRGRQRRAGLAHTIRSTTLDPEPPPPEYVAVSGGMFRDCGVHDFDIIRWVTGHEAVEVYATGSNRGADFFRAYDDVDTSAAVVTFADGALGVVSNTRYNAPRLRRPAGGARLEGQRRRRRRRRVADPRHRTRGDVPGRRAAPVLHGPLPAGLPGGVRDVPRGRRRRRGPRRARSPTGWKPTGSPRPARSP